MHRLRRPGLSLCRLRTDGRVGAGHLPRDEPAGTWRVGAHPVAIGERCEAIVIDGGRHVHLLSFHLLPDDANDNGELLYATNRTGSWRSSLANYGEFAFASLALDRDGRPNIAGTDEEGAYLAERTASGAWVTRYDTAGRPTHLRADPAGNLWVVMSDPDNDRFVRLTDRTGAWVASRIPVPYEGGFQPGLAIDGAGRRHLAIHRPSIGSVTIRRDLGATWPLVDRTRAPVERDLLEMDIEPSGAIHLLFLRTEPTPASVDLHRHGGVWKSLLVGYSSVSWSDIEVDGRGRVSAVYERDGVVWTYWNPWAKPASRFAISGL